MNGDQGASLTAAFDGAYVFTSQAKGFGGKGVLRVRRWRGRDALSEGYRFEIDLAQAGTDDRDCSPLLGRRATFANATLGVCWQGVVTRLEQTGHDGRYRYFQVVLEPQWTLARLDLANRVHADESAGVGLKALVDFTLKGCGLKTVASQPPVGQEPDPQDCGDYRWLVDEAHAAHFRTPFACQYAETSYDFLSRRLEHAGICYWFEKGGERETMVFCGNVDGQGKTTTLPWRPGADRTLNASGASVWELAQSASLGYGRVALGEHLPEDVALDLFAERKPAGEARHGQYGTYGEGYATRKAGELIARLRDELGDCMRRSRRAIGHAPALRAGRVVRITGHPQLSGDAALRVIEVWHEGRQPLPGENEAQASEPQVTTRWTAIDAHTPYRPALRTPVPRIPGLVTAVVESAKHVYDPLRGGTGAGQGSDGEAMAREYPYLNERGCYRIRFHFAENKVRWQELPGDGPEPASANRNDRPSAAEVPRNSGWVRMATPYAGASGQAGGEFGLYLPLNEGAEVLVSFLNGDPDRPVIVGAVPNSDNPSLVHDGRNEARSPDAADDPPAHLNDVAALVTQGGNVLAFNNAEGRQKAILAAPVANSYVAVGGDVGKKDGQGIVLATDRRITLQADSLLENVPGKGMRRVYDLASSSSSGDSSDADGKSKSMWDEFKENSSADYVDESEGAKASLFKPEAEAILLKASASVGLDFSVKVGLSFSAMASASWSFGFGYEGGFNFANRETLKKSEDTKIQSRTSTVLKDIFKAVESHDQVVDKTSSFGSHHVKVEKVDRVDAGEAVTLAVLNAAPTAQTANQGTWETAVRGQSGPSLVSMLLPPPFPKAEPDIGALTVTDVPADPGQSALSSLLLDKDKAELKGKKVLLEATDTTTTVKGKGKVLIEGKGATAMLDDEVTLQSAPGSAMTLESRDGTMTLDARGGPFKIRGYALDQKATTTLQMGAEGLVKIG